LSVAVTVGYRHPDDGDLLQFENDLTPTASLGLQLAASLEQFSDHPLALAIVAHARAKNVPLLDPDSFSSTAGGGVTGEIGGRSVAAGSPAFLQSLGVDLGNGMEDVKRLQDAGYSLVAVAQTSPAKLRAILALRDQLRDDAAATLAVLRGRGTKVGVVSGDTEPAVRGALAGVPLDLCLANVKPEEKAATVGSLRHSRGTGQKGSDTSVAFVGDGINDAPALAAADLGITLSSGTDLAKAAGDVILLSPHLMAVADTLALSRRTLRIIKQNLFWAFGYNFIAVPLAMWGRLSPGLAAGFMIGSSLLVVGNALRLYRVRLDG
jgi:Cu+-exporting ATPase